MTATVLIPVARTTDIPVGEVRRFDIDGVPGGVAVANLGEDGFLAVADQCSHAEASLSEGEVDTDDATIECPRHGSTFDLRTGRPRTLPATTPVASFPVKVEGDVILIELED
jgi:3-phenylpropionate/trans-cinnamate dioxygenase ferredoxin subunit